MSHTCQNGSIARFYYGLKLLFLRNRWGTLKSALPAGKLRPFSIRAQQMLERVGEAESWFNSQGGWRDASGGATYIIFLGKSTFRGAFSVEMSPKACCVLEKLASMG